MRRPDVFTLDYSHPLAQGLELSALFRSSLLHSDDLARHKIVLYGAEITNNGAYIPSSGYVAFDNIVNAASATAYTLTIRGAFSSLGGWASGDVFVRHGGMVLSRYAGAYLRWYQGATGANLAGLGDFGSNGDVDIVFTHNGIRRTVYYNGLVVYDADWLGLSKQSGTLYIGGDGSTFASGPSIIKHVFFHNRALSPAEIAILADRTDPMLGGLVREVNPVAYFDFGGASSGTDNLTATDLVTGSPVLGTPALGQVHALTATGITTSAPALGTPALGQVHGLAATALTVSAPVLGTPAVGQIHSLTASALVVGSPVLGTPLLSENAPDVDALTAVDLVVGSPVLGTPSFGQIHVLGSDGLVTGTPVLGSPSITQIHALEALGLTVGVPVLGTPAINGSDVVLIDASEVGKNYRATLAKRNYTARL